MNYDKTFLISDQHFGHANILKFTKADGTPVRPDFKDVEDMNQFMISQHNKTVGPDDIVYFLGDVAFKASVFHKVMPLLNGKKRLILGNHDHLKISDYMQYFGNIASAEHIKYSDTLKFVLCHYPMHPEANSPNYPICIHGHIHEKNITDTNHINGDIIRDKRYINVSVEQINYTPISMTEIISRYKEE